MVEWCKAYLDELMRGIRKNVLAEWIVANTDQRRDDVETRRRG